MERPSENDYAPYYQRYVSLVPETDVLEVLAGQPAELRRLAAATPAARETHRYEPGKWSVREVFGHLQDSEQIFGYRTLCISRGDQAPLPGFDQEEYLRNSAYGLRPLADTVREFDALRGVNLSLLRALDGAGWDRRGTANDAGVTVRALAFIMAGHVRHHFGVIRSRYGIDA
jgi:hypothetical protein